MTCFTETARAKINLTLDVLGRRADGYHALSSLVAFADIGDRVTLEPGRDVAIAVTGSFAAAIVGRNILDATLAAVRAAEPRLTLGHVTLEKVLPVASGIGGGSADAAALLRAIRAANPDRESSVDWPAIAANLGADVPVCFANSAAIISGTGTLVQRVAGLAPLAAILANPLTAVPANKTAAVFKALHADPIAAGAATQAAAASRADAGSISDLIRGHNDLTDAACKVIPAIGAVLTALAELPGCRLARLSGAGPTCFAIFADPSASTTAAAALAARYPDWWIKAALLS